MADASDSRRLAVILGAPRSGTTWLQRLLAAHPQIASPQETHLFDHFLGPLYRRWDQHSGWIEQLLPALDAGTASALRVNGLTSILMKDDLDRASRMLVTALLDRTLARKPGAWIVLEKTPSNALRVELIDRLVPDCLYIHIVRDPRDVSASLMAAGRTWGPEWAPLRPQRAAQVWREHVLGARQASRFEGRYLELRYEDLRKDPGSLLCQLHQFLGVRPLDATGDGPHELGRLIVRRDLEERLPAAGLYEPEGMGKGDRVLTLTPAEQLAVTRHTGDLLVEFGYGNSARWSSVPARTRWTRTPMQLVGEHGRHAAKQLVFTVREVGRRRQWGGRRG